MKKKYTIGVDFGTLSGRAVLVDVEDGKEIATSITHKNLQYMLVYDLLIYLLK